MYVFSALSYKIGQALIRRYGMNAAARHLRNLGIPLHDAIEILAMRPIIKG